MRTVLVVLLWCGAALAQPAVRPAPPAFNPAQDAPHTVGQPGYLEPQRVHPPEPRPTRVLPETPETRRGPGIWATNPPMYAPQRQRGDPIPDLRVLDVPVPHHPDAKDGWETAPTEQCVATSEYVFMAGDMGLAARAHRLSGERRTCLVALDHESCVEDLHRRWHAAMAASGAVSPLATWFDKALESARAWARKTCGPRPDDPEIDAILRAMEVGNRRARGWAQ